MKVFTVCRTLVGNAFQALNGDFIRRTEFEPVKEKLNNIDKTIHHGDGNNPGLFEMVIRIDQQIKANGRWDGRERRNSTT